MKWHIFIARMAAGAISTEVEALADLEAVPREELIEAISHGLPSSMVRELANKMQLTLEQMAGLLRLTSRTLQRRLEDGHLELAKSERLWKLSRLFRRATEVLENEPAAGQWFKSPIQALGGATPLALAHTAVGLRELENILGRIEHGVFS